MKDDSDMLDEMDVDEFLNAEFLESSDDEEMVGSVSYEEGESMLIAQTNIQGEKDLDNVDDGSISEEDECFRPSLYDWHSPWG
ncbi:hypothetical protein PsorP6_019197 [Peronosclerospora sorghi]|nr:hypothetical protein PsorP6_019197 [Peronosclerospora sorghi]